MLVPKKTYSKQAKSKVKHKIGIFNSCVELVITYVPDLVPEKKLNEQKLRVYQNSIMRSI